MGLLKIEGCVQSFKKGDKNSFSLIYDATYRAVYFKALEFMKNKSDAEDITQEVYLKVYTSIHTYVVSGGFLSWILKITENLCLNEIRKRSREYSVDFQTEGYKYEKGKSDEYSYLFELAKQNLRSDEYEIVMLCQVCGYKRREVAEALKMPIATITWKNNEALKKLRKVLEK